MTKNNLEQKSTTETTDSHELGRSPVVNNDLLKNIQKRPRPLHRVGYGPLAAILVTVFSYIVSQIIGYALIGTWVQLTSGDVNQVLAKPSIELQFSLFLIIETITILIVYRFLKNRGLSLGSIGLKRKIRASDVARALGVFFVYFLFLMAVTAIISGTGQVDTEQRQQIGFDGANGSGQLLLVFLSLAILPPIAEEILFRGFLYTGLLKKMNIKLAAVVVSLIFAVLHLQIGSGAPPLYMAAIDTFILSLFLVYLREKTGSLWAGMIVHFMKNSLAFLALFVIKINGV